MSEQPGRTTEIFLTFLRLGLTSFGGPVAHLGYFRAEFVERKGWISDRGYADLVALCQFLPGPASSQVVMGIGLSRGGVAGALLASLGFTLPSMLLMIAFGYGAVSLGGDLSDAAWIHALKVVAAAVVAQAVWGMAQRLCPDRLRGSIALATAALLVVWPGSLTQLAAIAAGALIGWRLCKVELAADGEDLPMPISRPLAILMLALFFLLLALAILLKGVTGVHALDLFGAMYRSGALVFGGGHVILPLLQIETVAPGWIGDDAFLAGYGAAQALPGPLFTFASFLGTAQLAQPNGWLGGLIATAGIFLPSFLLLFGALPFWVELRNSPSARSALAGVNAAVVGLLIAAFYDPVFTSAIDDGRDLALGFAAFACLALWKIPAWVVVIGAGTMAGIIGALGA